MRSKGAFVTLLFVCLTSVIATSQIFTITDLGPLAPTAINSWAQIVGNYHNQAYMWSFGRMRALGILPGGTFSSATGINDLGVVVGTADGPVTIPGDDIGPTQECSDVTQPFIWKQGIQGLGVVDYATDAWQAWCYSPFYGSGINNRGQVVGYTGSLDSEYQWGILWTSTAGMTLFGSSWPPTFVNGINNSGQMVGQNGWTATSALGIGHATSWKNGVATDLGTLGGEVFDYGSAANGINDLGLVVGWSTTSFVSDCCDVMSSPVHAILWKPNGTMQDLGTLQGDTSSAAVKINLLGQVIGSSGSSLYGFNLSANSPFQVIGRPFIWSAHSGMQDLNALIRANSGWVLNTANDINAWGQIVGQGTLNGQPHGFLLTPRNLFQPY